MQIAKWRQLVLEHLPELFVDGRTHQTHTSQAETDALYEQIGQLKREPDWLPPKSGPARLMSCALWWSVIMRKSAFDGNEKAEQQLVRVLERKLAT